MPYLIFTRESVGCYADGGMGRHRLRAKLAALLTAADDSPRAFELACELEEEETDDLSEELDAVELLNEHCEQGIAFEFVDGDLVLLYE